MTNDSADDDLSALAAETTPRWQKVLAITVAGVTLAAAAFAIGRFTAFDSTPAAQVPLDSSAEAGFARDMQTHHQQAVQMAMIIYPKTQDADVRAIAYDIATAQSAQLGQMQQWLLDWNLPAYGSAPAMQWMASSGEHSAHGDPSLTPEERNAQMGMATQEQLDELASASGTAADCQFLELMIRHHEGAIDMVDAIEELGSHASVLDLADKMATTQTSEITAMQMLQSRFGCSA